MEVAQRRFFFVSNKSNVTIANKIHVKQNLQIPRQTAYAKGAHFILNEQLLPPSVLVTLPCFHYPLIQIFQVKTKQMKIFCVNFFLFFFHVFMFSIHSFEPRVYQTNCTKQVPVNLDNNNNICCQKMHARVASSCNIKIVGNFSQNYYNIRIALLCNECSM